MRQHRGRRGRTRLGGGRLRDRAARHVHRRLADRDGDDRDRGAAQSGRRAQEPGTLEADGRGGLLALGFPGTVASLFTGSARDTYAAKTTAGRYLFLYAAPATQTAVAHPAGELRRRLHRRDRNNGPGQRRGVPA